MANNMNMILMPPVGINLVVSIFDLRVAMGVSTVIIFLVSVTDAIFSVIVTFIFLKPMLEVLRAGKVSTAGSRRLDRTKRWNFLGVFVTVMSSTVLYLNLIAFFLLTMFNQHSLNHSVWGNPFTFGLALDSMLNTLGVLLLCGMFEESPLRSPLSLLRLINHKAPIGKNKVAAAVDRVPKRNHDIDNHARSNEEELAPYSYGSNASDSGDSGSGM
jgi:hypothetical protein